MSGSWMGMISGNAEGLSVPKFFRVLSKDATAQPLTHGCRKSCHCIKIASSEILFQRLAAS